MASGTFYLQVFSREEYPDALQSEDLDRLKNGFALVNYGSVDALVDTLEHPADYYVISVSVHETQ